MTTIKELKEILKENGKEYTEIECYKYNSRRKTIHTDFIESVDEYSDNDIIEEYQLMNEEDYNNTILANSCITANFDEWYDNKDALVLIVIIKDSEED